MAGLPKLRIDGPPPTAAPFGLVTTPGTIVVETDEHWQGGVAIEGYPADLPQNHDPCSVGSQRVKEPGSEPPLPDFGSFTVVLPMSCSGIGIGNAAGFQRIRERARVAFEAKEGFGAEREFMFGDANAVDKPFLADANVVILGGGTVGPREGLSLLEGAIGETAQTGFIHVDAATFVAWAWSELVDAVGGVMKTKRGNTVIIGDGYAGAVPDGEAALPDPGDEGYAFATGPVRVSRSAATILPTTLAEALNRDNNDLTLYGERNYVAYWDTALQAAVRIERSATP